MEGYDTFEFEGALEHSLQEQKDVAKPRLAFKAIHKREVCRYWLNNCCKKGDACEFLHSFEQDKMPICRKGAACGDPSCFLTHPSKDEKPVCPNFAAGFCSFGYSCQWRHDVSEDAPPAIAVQFLAADPAKLWIASRKAAQRSFRTAPCPYFHNDGWCPYFLSCAFSHELKTPAAPLSLTSFPPLPTRPQLVVAPVAVPAHSFDRPPSRRGPPPTFLPRGGRGTWRRGGARGFPRGGFSHSAGPFNGFRGRHFDPRFHGASPHGFDPRFQPSMRRDVHSRADEDSGSLRIAADDSRKEWGEMAFE